MAKISSYPILSTPTLNDMLIGTDVNNFNETKNFLISDIAAFILADDYVPYLGANRDLDLGINSFKGGSFIVNEGSASDFLKADGTLDSTVYQVAGNYITQISGEASGSGPGNANVTLSNSAVIGKVLTGLNITGNVITSSDSILTAFGKVQNQINTLVGGVQYQGTWNANTNTPTLTSSVGIQGHYYVVSVPGSTNLNGITDWKLGDWAIFNGSSWDKVDNTDAVISVNGEIGAVVLTTTDISEGTNLYYTDIRVRGAISLTNTGNNGPATYNGLTGQFNIPEYTLTGLGGVPLTREITINGTKFDLSANRSYNVGTVTSIGTTGPITGGTITGSGTIGISQSGLSSDGYLSSTDWNTFNGKQNALTNPVTGTGTAYTLPMWSNPTELMDSPLSYASNEFTFEYNSISGGIVNFTNIGLTPYTYSISMNNFGSPKSTVHNYTSGLIINSIAGTQISRVFQNGNTIFGPGLIDNGYKLEVSGSAYVDSLTLNPNLVTTPTAQGSLYFDNEEQTVAAVLNGSVMKIGEDMFFQIKNQSGATIPKGTSVRFDGVVGSSGRVLAVPFLANGSFPSLYFLGVTSEEILDGQDGKAYSYGKIRGLNTNAYPTGTILYASTTVAGGFQTTAPVAPNNIISIAAVVTQGTSNGTILIRPQIGSNINNDEGVKIVSPVTGDLLQLQSSGLWENKSVASLNLVPQTRTLSINGTSYDLSANRSWSVGTITSLTGEATASGSGAVNVTLNNTSVISKVLTGLNVTGGTVISTDSILSAFGKVQNQINGLIGGSIFQGTWNASTNIPSLSSSVGTNGHYYIVSVAGSTNLNGITDWQIGDWAIFAGTTWQKVDNTDAVSSVNGYTGTVSLVTGDVLEGSGSLPSRPSQLYFTNARARSAVSLTTSGTSGVATYDNGTGVLNIPNYGSALSGYLPLTGGTVTGTLTVDGSGNTTPKIVSVFSGGANRLLTPVLRLYGSTDISSKYIELFGGNATANRSIQFPDANGTVVLGSGTTNYLSKFTSSGTIGDSLIFQDPIDNRLTINNNFNGTSRFQLYNTDLGTSANVFIAAITTGNRYISLLSHGQNATGTTAGLNNAGLQELQTGDDSSGLLINAFNNIPIVFANGISFSNTEKMRITTSGNVGIGTTSPSVQFNVGHSNHGIGVAYMGASSLPAIAGIFTDSTSGQQGFGSLLIKSRTDFANYSINFYTAGTANVIQERMRITSSGNVGIGTDSPIAPLQLRGQSVEPRNGFFISTNSFVSLVSGSLLRIGHVSSSGNTNAIIQNLGLGGSSGIGDVCFPTGNVGIGDTNPTSGAGWIPKLVLKDTLEPALIVKGVNGQENSFGTSNGLYIDSLGNSSGSNNIIAFRSTNLNSSFDVSERMRINSVGNILIGTTSEAALSGTNGIIVQKPNAAISLSSGVTPNQSWLMYRADADSSIRWYNGLDRMKITSSGNLLIGTDINLGFRLTVNGNGYFSGTSNTVQIYSDNNSLSLALGYQGVAGGYLGGISGRLEAYSVNGGYVFLNASSVWVAASDKNRKRNFENYNLGLEAILKLQPKHYHMDFQENDDVKQVGLIAQDVKEFIPDAYEENQKFIGLNYNAIIVTLVNAIKDLKSEIDILKNN